MEIVLNLAWAACSLGLILFWIRTSASNRIPRGTQILALAIVVLLLLPVISLSDDLIAMQGLAETDSSMRRACHLSEGHAPVAQASFVLPEQAFPSQAASGVTIGPVQSERLAPPPPLMTRSLDRRPPPRA